MYAACSTQHESCGQRAGESESKVAVGWFRVDVPRETGDDAPDARVRDNTSCVVLSVPGLYHFVDLSQCTRTKAKADSTVTGLIATASKPSSSSAPTILILIQFEFRFRFAPRRSVVAVHEQRKALKHPLPYSILEFDSRNPTGRTPDRRSAPF